MSVNPGPLLHGQFYHIYARGNNHENIFIEEANFAYFLCLYAKYIQPVADTYAYCLLRNHFHVLVRVKTIAEQMPQVDETAMRVIQPSQQFSNLLNAYAKAVNRRYNRRGSLFQSRFGRKLILTDNHLYAVIAYIHHNPQHHGFVTDFREWSYSSYHALTSDKPTRLNREQVLEWFGSRKQLMDNSLSDEAREAIRPLFVDD